VSVTTEATVLQELIEWLHCKRCFFQTKELLALFLKLQCTVEQDSLPPVFRLRKFYTEQIFVLVSMNILGLC